jgi:nucleotide-binding universal stress UspA family protein/L-amino acid N-acyltransferase YncA
MRLLVALDDTRIASEVLRTVGTWARAWGTEVSLLQVVDPSEYESSPAHIAPTPPRDITAVSIDRLSPGTTDLTLREAAQADRSSALESSSQAFDRLQAERQSYLAELTARYLEGVTTRSLVRSAERPAEEIVEVAREQAADMVVLGKHRRQGLQRVFRRSVADAVVRQSALPVLLVTERETLAPQVPEGAYPRSFQIAGTEVTLGLMGREDRAAVLEFARALPPHDLLFLRRDITEPDVVEDWIADIEDGFQTTVLAYTDRGVVGYMSVERSRLEWMRQSAEIRVVVAEWMRARHLGRVLAQDAFRIAVEMGVRRMTAQMTRDQQGAVQLFSRLGFESEAILPKYVTDRDGNPHDLLVMGRDVESFAAEADSELAEP